MQYDTQVSASRSFVHPSPQHRTPAVVATRFVLLIYVDHSKSALACKTAKAHHLAGEAIARLEDYLHQGFSRTSLPSLLAERTECRSARDVSRQQEIVIEYPCCTSGLVSAHGLLTVRWQGLPAMPCACSALLVLFPAYLPHFATWCVLPPSVAPSCSSLPVFPAWLQAT